MQCTNFTRITRYRLKTKCTLAGLEEIQQGNEESFVACVVGTGWWESTEVQTITHIILLYVTALYCISLHYYSAHCCTNTYIALHYATTLHFTAMPYYCNAILYNTTLH